MDQRTVGLVLLSESPPPSQQDGEKGMVLFTTENQPSRVYLVLSSAKENVSIFPHFLGKIATESAFPLLPARVLIISFTV